MGGAAGAARGLLGDLVGLVLPVCCAGCGAADVPWCAACEEALHDVARREDGCPRLDRMDRTPPLPVWTAAVYDGPVRAAVLAWKDGGRADLGSVMVAAVVRAARAAAGEMGGPRQITVVPVPSRPASVRRRGEDLVARLAAGVVAELGGPPAARLERAVTRRGGRDQAGLGARARARNAAAFRLRGKVDPGSVYWLVDDVVTTGATLGACADALAGAGGVVLGAVAVAATPGFTRSALLHRGYRG
jgi:predicted amidophosphoribosyltransferase